MLGAWPEPWKDDRHAAADGLAGGEEASLAHEKNRRFASRLEVSDMSAVEIDVGLGERRVDGQPGQVALSGFENSDSGDFKAAQSRGWFHRRRL